MASIAFQEIGTIRHTETSQRPFSLFRNYVELTAGAYIVVSVNTLHNQCIVDFLLDQSGKSLRSLDADRELLSLRDNFRLSKVIHVLKTEGSITTVELARDYRKAVTSDSVRKRSIDMFHVHLFIGTAKGTVIVCDALRGTILALALFQYRNLAAIAKGEDVTTSEGENENEAIVRFAVHAAAPESRPISTVVPSTMTTTSDALYAVYVIHSGGRVVLLNRAALDVFVKVAEQRPEGKRPHFALEWSPESSLSSFPVAGPAGEFATHLERVSVLKENDHYSSIELQTIQGGWDHVRQVRDAACFLSKCADTTEVLRSGPNAVDSLLLCGEAPALAVYALKNTRPGFSAKRTVSAVVSVIGGMARSIWGRGSGDQQPSKPRRLDKVPQYVKNAFFEADMTFTTMQVDPSWQWTACYSEVAGRIYIYDNTTGIICRVLKGCRAAEYQWHVARFGGKRILLLLVHLQLRHAVEVHSLRLGRRIAARHTPPGATMLRPGTAEGGASVLMLTASGEVMRLSIELDEKEEDEEEEDDGEEDNCTYREDSQSEVKGTRAMECGASDVSGTVSRSTTAASSHSLRVKNKVRSDSARAGHRTTGEESSSRESYRTPYDVLRAVLRFPLSKLDEPLRDSSGFTHYRTEMKALEKILMTRFSADVSGDRCLALPPPINLKNIPRDVTAAQCLNFAELRLACVENYRRAVLFRGESSAEAMTVLVEDEALFSLNMEPHPVLEAAVRTAAVAVFKGAMGEDVADVLPAFTRIMRAADLATAERSEGDAPMGITEFLQFFHCGGYNLDYLRSIVSARELTGEVDLSARIGSVFFVAPRGFGVLRKQLEVFCALGFTTTDVSTVSLSWLCRAFAAAPAPQTLGSLAGFTFFLRAGGDAAFLDGVERVHIPFLSSRAADHVHAESSLLLLVLSLLMRHHEKPVAAAHSKRHMQLLQQALVLCAVLRHCVGYMTRFATVERHWIRLGAALRPDDFDKIDTAAPSGSSGGDALTAFFFSHAPADLAPLLCESIPGGVALRSALGDVDALELTRLVASPDMPWFCDGVWNSSAFARGVVQPLTELAAPILALQHRGLDGDSNTNVNDASCDGELGNVKGDGMDDVDDDRDGDCMTGPQLAGLVAILATTFIVFERETARLRDGSLQFLQRSAAPDANIFVSPSSASSHLDAPRGSRATRDYFASCRDLLLLMHAVALPLLNLRGCSFVRHIIEAFTVDDAALLPLLPAELRRTVTLLTEILQRFPSALRCRLDEARAFVDTVTLLAFTPAQAALASAQLSVPWGAMFEPPAVLLRVLPRDGDFAAYGASGGDDGASAARLEARSAFMRAAVAGRGGGDFAGGLCRALGLCAAVGDLPQLVALDAAARRVTPAADIARALGRVMSRRLAARIAAANFRLVVAAVRRHCAKAKGAVARESRAEMQRAALRVQRVDGCMSDACERWVRAEPERSAAVALPREHRLVACWTDAPDAARAVERRVGELLRMLPTAQERAELSEALTALARIAAEGRDELGEDLRRVAEELPSVATRLANVL